MTSIIILFLLFPLCQVSSLFMFDKITNPYFPHEKMGFVMTKHINHSAIVHNSNERHLTNSQINMVEWRECDIESNNDIRSWIMGVRVNYCFKCTHTSSYLADINSCKYDVVNTYSNDFNIDFHTYTDSSCSVDEIYQFTYSEELNVCYYGFKAVYTTDFKYDVSIPGLTNIEYSDTSCSTPFAFETKGIVKETCMQISLSSSMEIVECTNNIFQYRTYLNPDCSGNTFTEETDAIGTCDVPIFYLVWYEELSNNAVIDYSNERSRYTIYCSSLYSPIRNPTSSPNLNPTPYPTSYIGIIPPNDADYTETCDNCPSHHIWTVECGIFGTPNTDIMCDENGDEFTCCASHDDDCCVANGGNITILVFGIIVMIGVCAYKCYGRPTKEQIAITIAHKHTTTDKELIKPTIKPFQKTVQATPTSMEEGIPFAEAKIIPNLPTVKASKNKNKNKRGR